MANDYGLNFRHFMNVDAKLFYAETVCDRIEKWIQIFSDETKDSERIVVSVIMPDGTRIYPTFFGYQNPNFIVAYATDERGGEIVALIPHTNIHVMMSRAPAGPDQPKRKIGFQTREQSAGDGEGE